MVGTSTWRLSNETAARNLQLTTLSYTPKGIEENVRPNDFAPLDYGRRNQLPRVNANVIGRGHAHNGNGIPKTKQMQLSKQPDVACINSSSMDSSIRSSAVVIRNGMKFYGSGRSTATILNNFNMTVPKGTIYSLLGSSGCGKTTVLSCIVGLKNLNSGQISVFGKCPGKEPPGKMLGYMTQELALYESLSIREIISFYGSLTDMTRDEISCRVEFLVKLLDLPDANRKIDCLSSGQKRRVSLALTLVHSPELLILDEPTVGVDPLLRESIWEHLTTLVSTLGTTVIITTHYVEEAHRSHTVGLMRSGKILTEDNPQKLLIEHQADSLNQIVLNLCKNDKFQENHVRNDRIVPAITSNLKESEPFPSDNFKYTYTSSFRKIKALTMKNALLMMRNFWLILLILLNPAFDVCLVNFAMGGDPSNLHFGVVNNEMNITNDGTPACPNTSFEYETCILANISCRLLNKISHRNTFTMHEFPNEETAITAIDDGKIWGFISFPFGYTDSLFERATEGLNIANESLDLSNMNVKIDATNRPVAAVILNTLFESYKEFIRGLLTDCGFNPDFGDLPVKVLPPTHGTVSTDMKEFVAPGILLGILFFFPFCSGALAVIYEKKQGTLQRTQVAGASIFELMVSFLITQFMVLLVQSVTTFCLTTYYFGIDVNGSVPLALSMSVLVGLDGVSMGFLVAAFCNGELEAVIIGIGYFLANFIASGTLWPTQAQPVIMQYFAYLFPATLPNEAVRSIISRGWGFTHSRVWPGFMSEGVRITLFWVLTIFIHRAVLSRK